jgi:ubiquinone/menaquinone biosynthesis C-methylase UbiE
MLAMHDTDNGVQDYFSGLAGRYEEIYGNASLARRLIVRLRWRSLFLYHRYTFDACDCRDKQILDVGCGTGVYAIEATRRGGAVVALDFSDAMIAIAKRNAESMGMGEKIYFKRTDFRDFAAKHDQNFDLILAIGVFDYVQDPHSWLTEMSTICNELIVSFPTPSPVQPIRKLRYRMLGVYNRTYRVKQIRSMVSSSGFSVIDIRKVGLGGCWVHAKK